MFTLMDTNKDGKVTYEELKVGLRKVGSQLAEPEIKMPMEVYFMEDTRKKVPAKGSAAHSSDGWAGWYNAKDDGFDDIYGIASHSNGVAHKDKLGAAWRLSLRFDPISMSRIKVLLEMTRYSTSWTGGMQTEQGCCLV